MEDEESEDLEPWAGPQATPPGWAAPTPLPPEPTPPQAEAAAEPPRPTASRTRRFLTTTIVFVAIFMVSLSLINVEGTVYTSLFFLVPAYLLTLLIVMPSRGKRPKTVRPRLVERIEWQQRLMVGVAVFLAAYVPFMIFSNAVIPYAAIVEYGVFSLLLFLLLRLGGRSTGVAPSLDALPPPTHRLHQQVVANIDDRHYQDTLWLNYNFIERGKGAKGLAKRVQEILESNGVPPPDRAAVVSELETFEGGRRLFGRSPRVLAERDRRIQVLDHTFALLNQALERHA